MKDTYTMRPALRDMKRGTKLELRNGTPVEFVRMYSAYDGQAAIVKIDLPSDLRNHGRHIQLTSYESGYLTLPTPDVTP